MRRRLSPSGDTLARLAVEREIVTRVRDAKPLGVHFKTGIRIVASEPEGHLLKGAIKTIITAQPRGLKCFKISYLLNIRDLLQAEQNHTHYGKPITN